VARQDGNDQTLKGDGYKALVYLYFDGGCDSYNMLAPHTCPDRINAEGQTINAYANYLAIRGQVALTNQTSLEVDASNSLQSCTSYGLHPNLPFLQRLYNESSILFVANAGLLVAPVDKTNYRELTPTQLFAHNAMNRDTKRVDLYNVYGGTGVVGRINDMLTKRGYVTGAYSISGNDVTLAGQPGKSPAASILSSSGVAPFNEDPSITDMNSKVIAVNGEMSADSSFYGETWSDALALSISQHTTLYNALQSPDANTHVVFPTTSLGNQLEVVAKLIKIRNERGTERDLFYVRTGGFDTHSYVIPALAARFDEVNAALEAFVDELKFQGVWLNTTIVQFSEFARTLNPNGNDGTDHAWGGQHFIAGGSVLGGKILGTYPEDFSESTMIGLSRGRMIPTTPWDAILNGVAEWCGVTDQGDLGTVLPMKGNFPSESIYNMSEIYA